MKLIIILVTAFSGIAMAGQIDSKCNTNAEKALKNHVQKSYYDENSMSAYSCAASPNDKVVVCQVEATKGNGAAADTFRVVMNRSCTYIFRIDLISEE